MKKKRKRGLLIVLMVLVIGGIAGAFYISRLRQGEESTGGTIASEREQAGNSENLKEIPSDIPLKTEYTEEEKARVETQTGVSVTDEGTMEIDVGAILSEEASVKIKREEAENMVLEQLGGDAQIETPGIREDDGVKYWSVRASKGGEVCQIWLNADNGEEFINQTE